MKKIYISLLILVSLILFFFRIGIVQNKRVSFGLSTFLTTQGGTGTTSPSGILYGDNGATGSLKTATIGSGLSFSGGTLSSTGGTNYLTNSGINTYLNTGTFLQAPAFVATSSSATTTIQNLNNIFYVPEDFATNGCAGDSSKTKLDTCVEALLSLAVSKGLTTATIWITADVPQSAWTGTMDIAQNGLQTSLFCRSGVRLKYGGSGNAILWNNGDPTGHLKQEIAGCIFMGQNSLIAAGNSNSTTTVGIYYGGSQGAVGINTHDNTFNGFGTQVEIGANAYMLEFNNNGFSGGNGGRASQGSLVHINTASNSGERNVFNGNNFTDPANGDADECFYIEQTGTASNFITNNSIDNCQIVVLASNGQVVISENHFENPGAPSGFAEYIPILGASSDGSVTMNINGNEFANSASNRTWTTIIRHGGQLYASGNRIDNYNGFTVTNFVLHDLNNGQSSDHVCQTQVQGGNLTNIIGGSGGTTWSLTNGVPCLINRSNSYTIGLRALGSNTNQFFSGGSTVGTFDHDGNWTLGDSAVDSLTTIYKRLYVPNSIGIGTSSPFTMLGVAGTITTNNINATSTATSTIANLGGVLYAPAFQDAGEDIGKAINDAYAFCPLKGCIIEVPRGQFSFSTPILLNTNGKRALVRGTPAGGTELTYTGTATSTTINWGIQASGIDHTSGCGISDITFTANARSTSTSPIIGIEVGGTNGSDCTELTNVNVQGFGFGIWHSANNYNFNFQNGVIRNNGRAVHIAPASNSGELISYNDAFIVDGFATYGANAVDCFVLADSASASLLLNGVSFDDCQLHIGQANNVTINGGHWENVGYTSWGKYTYIVIDNNLATNVSINGTTFFNVANTLPLSPDQFISNGGTLTLNGAIFRRFGGVTIPVAVTLTSTGRMSWFGLNNVSNAVFTEIISGVAPTLNGSTGTSNFQSMGIGTSTQHFQLTVSSTTKPQLSLSAGTGFAQTTFRNDGTNFYISSSTVVGTATTSTSMLEIALGGFGTTTVRGLTITGQATSTSNVGFNLTGGCFAINNNCITGGGSGTPGGSNGQIQYNASGAFGGVSTSTLAVGSSISSSGTLGSQIGGSNTTLSLNMANANTWTALQTFAYSSTTGASFDYASSTLGVFGRVGIGSTSPTSSLTVSGSGIYSDGQFNESSTLNGIFMGKPSGATSIQSGRILFTTGTAAKNWQIDNDDGTFRWFLPGVVHLTLSSTALTVPQGILTVSGTGNSSIAGRLGIADTSADYRLEATGSTGNGYFGLTNSVDGDIFTVNSSGLVGISSTTPTYTLSVGSSNTGTIGISTTTNGTVKSTNGLFWVDSSASSGGYNLVQDEGTPLTARTTINCVGAGITCSDSGSVTTFTVTGSSFTGAINSIVTTDSSGNLQATGTQLTVGNLIATTTASSYFNGNLGVGTTSPWGEFSVLYPNPDYNNPLMSVATSATPYGQAINVFASSSAKTFGGLFNGQNSGIKVIFGAIKKFFSNYFFNGTVASSWESLECDSFKLIANLSADTNDICGFVDFDETTTAVLNQYLSNGYDGATLQVSAGVTADSAQLFMGTVNARTLASTTPKMEVVVGAVTTLSSTTQISIGWNNSINASTIGCDIQASTTPNWQAVCKTAIATETRVDTGIATSTAYVKFTLELGSSRFLVSAQTTETGDPVEVANITSDIPSSATSLQARIGIRRLTLGNSATPALNIVGLRYYKYASWWGGGN